MSTKDRGDFIPTEFQCFYVAMQLVGCDKDAVWAFKNSPKAARDRYIASMKQQAEAGNENAIRLMAEYITQRLTLDT